MNKKKLEEISNFYEPKNDYDYINTMLAFKIFQKQLHGKSVLEIGCADGAMTELLVQEAFILAVVEPSTNYCNIIKNIKGVRNIYNGFLEDIQNPLQYDIVLCASLIHHIEEPNQFLNSIKKFLKPSGVVLATVPHVKSLHRRIGVKMGLLSSEYGDSERNVRFAQFGRYDMEKFQKLFEHNRYSILESYGYMIKPFSSDIMEKIGLNEKQVQAMFEIGKEFQEISSQLYIKATI